MAIKHNKKKNTSIVYEQLMTLMANLMAEKKLSELDAVKSLVVKHFNKNSNLFREKRLFDSLLSYKNKDLRIAERFLDECLVESSLFDSALLEQEKVALINDIMQSIGKEIFSVPVKSYKLRASAQFLLNEMRSNLKYSTPEDRLKLKLYLVENIQKVPQEEEIGPVDRLTFKLLKDRYIKKYSPVLNANQQKVLVEWNEHLANKESSKFVSFLNEQHKTINKQLDRFVRMHPKHEDIELLKEACVKTKNSIVKDVSEEDIYETLRYWDVIEDLNEAEANV